MYLKEGDAMIALRDISRKAYAMQSLYRISMRKATVFRKNQNACSCKTFFEKA
ncbi:hypothetical protein CE91St46_16280 [Eubacteriales bacterium]|nr:hypothetical protein CE91St46_16280 [Eubacteriales bacterium]GKH63239.1 hypothetical protein CE91St47_17080 [Eubacteriales bacterium]